MNTPYNVHPSMPLQEAFQRANACVAATQSMRYTAGSMSDMQWPALLEQYRAVSDTHNAAVRAAYAALAALHNDDIEAAQQAAHEAEEAKQQGELALRVIFEAYLAEVRNTTRSVYNLQSEHGTVGVFTSMSVSPADERHGEFVYLTMTYPGDPTFDVPF